MKTVVLQIFGRFEKCEIVEIRSIHHDFDVRVLSTNKYYRVQGVSLVLKKGVV
jgi:hypothetical protein